MEGKMRKMVGTVTVNIKINDANDLEGVTKRVMALKKSYPELNAVIEIAHWKLLSLNEEKSTTNFCGNCGCELNGGKKEETEEEKFERFMNNYLKSHKRVLFPTGSEGEAKEDMDSDATSTSGHS